MKRKIGHSERKYICILHVILGVFPTPTSQYSRQGQMRIVYQLWFLGYWGFAPFSDKPAASWPTRANMCVSRITVIKARIAKVYLLCLMYQEQC